MIISTAIFDGFEKNITDKFYTSWGHIHIMNFVNPGDNLYLNSDLVLDNKLHQALKTFPNVQDAYPYQVQRSLLKSKTEMEGILLKGVDADYILDRSKFLNITGSTLQTDSINYSKQILLSSYTAKKLNIQAKDSLLLYFIQNSNELPRARKLQVSGIYQTGLQENDKHFAIADIKLLHRLANDSSNGIFGYELYVTDDTKTKETNDALYKNILKPPLNSYTIQERFKDVFIWLQLIKKDLNLIYIIVLIVAIINMTSSTLILILERTNMVGTLKSLGARTKQIAGIFFYQSLFITFLGTLFGALLAIIIAVLQNKFHFLKLDPNIYYINYVQIKLSLLKMVVIIGGTISISAILLLIPLILVITINPTKALRFD